MTRDEFFNALQQRDEAGQLVWLLVLKRQILEVTVAPEPKPEKPDEARGFRISQRFIPIDPGTVVRLDLVKVGVKHATDVRAMFRITGQEIEMTITESHRVQPKGLLGLATAICQSRDSK